MQSPQNFLLQAQCSSQISPQTPKKLTQLEKDDEQLKIVALDSADPLSPSPCQSTQSRGNKWTQEQQRLVFDLHAQLGNKWTQIASYLIYRSDNCVKNFFYAKLKANIQRLNKQLSQLDRLHRRPIKTHIIYKLIAICEDRYSPHPKYNAQFLLYCAELKDKIVAISRTSKIETQILLKLTQQIQAFYQNYRKKCSFYQIQTKKPQSQKQKYKHKYKVQKQLLLLSQENQVRLAKKKTEFQFQQLIQLPQISLQTPFTPKTPQDQLQVLDDPLANGLFLKEMPLPLLKMIDQDDDLYLSDSHFARRYYDQYRDLLFLP